MQAKRARFVVWHEKFFKNPTQYIFIPVAVRVHMWMYVSRNVHVRLCAHTWNSSSPKTWGSLQPLSPSNIIFLAAERLPSPLASLEAADVPGTLKDGNTTLAFSEQ